MIQWETQFLPMYIFDENPFHCTAVSCDNSPHNSSDKHCEANLFGGHVGGGQL